MPNNEDEQEGRGGFHQQCNCLTRTVLVDVGCPDNIPGDRIIQRSKRGGGPRGVMRATCWQVLHTVVSMDDTTKPGPSLLAERFHLSWDRHSEAEADLTNQCLRYPD